MKTQYNDLEDRVGPDLSAEDVKAQVRLAVHFFRGDYIQDLIEYAKSVEPTGAERLDALKSAELLERVLEQSDLDDEKAPDFWEHFAGKLRFESFKKGLIATHDGDCTKKSGPCVRCWAERLWRLPQTRPDMAPGANISQEAEKK